MTEALTAALHFAHGQLGLERVVADTLSANRRSVRLLERLGFREKDVRDGRHYFVRTRTMVRGDG